MVNWLNEFNRGRRSLKDEFRAGRPKTAIVPEIIDAVSELIMQDHHVTYREIKTSPGRNKDLFLLDLAQFDNRSKNGLCRLVLRNVGKIRSRCFKRRL